MKKKLLIFIVTYKASFRLLKLIQKIPYKKLSNFNYNIYISDDHSEDLSTFKYIKLVKNRYGSKIKVNYNKKILVMVEISKSVLIMLIKIIMTMR